jgi:hypothetical protein
MPGPAGLKAASVRCAGQSTRAWAPGAVELGAQWQRPS